jgi:hypothetical protein
MWIVVWKFLCKDSPAVPLATNWLLNRFCMMPLKPSPPKTPPPNAGSSSLGCCGRKGAGGRASGGTGGWGGAIRGAGPPNTLFLGGSGTLAATDCATPVVAAARKVGLVEAT